MTKPTPHYSPFGSLIPNRSWSDASRVYRYGFNGIEFEEETKWHYTEFRLYNPSLGVWISIDIKYKYAPNQSPYVFCSNSSVSYKDPKGDWGILGAIIGGAIGAVKEIGSQVIANGLQNMRDGKGFFDGALSKIDWVDVSTSAIEGAMIGSGVGALAVGLTKGVSIAVNGSFDYSLKDGNANIINGKKSLGAAAADLVFDAAGGIVPAKQFGKIGSMIASGVEDAANSKIFKTTLLGYAGEFFGDAVKGASEGLIWKEAKGYKAGEVFIREFVNSNWDYQENGFAKNMEVQTFDRVIIRGNKAKNKIHLDDEQKLIDHINKNLN